MSKDNVDHSFTARLKSKNTKHDKAERQTRIAEKIEQAKRKTSHSLNGHYHPELFIPELKAHLFNSDKTIIEHAYTRYKDNEPTQTNEEVEIIFPRGYPEIVIREIMVFAKEATKLSDNPRQAKRNFFTYEPNLPDWHPKHDEVQGGSRLVFKHTFFRPEFVAVSFLLDLEDERSRLEDSGVSVLTPPPGGKRTR